MNNLEEFKIFVERMNSTTSRNEKENILKEYRENECIKEILNFIYNPYIISGISDKKIKKIRNVKIPNAKIINNGVDNLDEVISYFKTHNTGRDEDLQYLQSYVDKNKEYEDLIYGIIKKDIKLGIQPKTINKIIPQLIPSFSVQLAERYFENPTKYLPQDTEYFLEQKYDGVRCIAIREYDEVVFYSRQGQVYEKMTELSSEFKTLPEGYIYDGELLLDNKDNLESKDLYRATMKVVGADDKKTNLIFNCFDILPIEEFKNGQSKLIAKERRKQLEDIFTKAFTPHIIPAPILYQGTDQTQITYWLDKITNEGGEGVMIYLANELYECKRTRNLLKVKKFLSADVRVIGIEEGTGKNKNKVGSLIIEFIGPDNKTYQNEVGSGLKDKDREFYWNNPDEIIGKIIEIGYFEISSNQNGTYGLRFPTFNQNKKESPCFSWG